MEQFDKDYESFNKSQLDKEMNKIIEELKQLRKETQKLFDKQHLICQSYRKQSNEIEYKNQWEKWYKYLRN